MGDNNATSKVTGTAHRINAGEIWCAENNIKNGKASGRFGSSCFLIAMLNDILFEGKLAEDWMLNSLLQIFKEKGHPVSPNSYRGMKLLIV